MLASLFATSPPCAFTLTRNIAAPAIVLFRSSSIASRKMSASGVPTNVTSPPSPTHHFIAFSSAWMSTARKLMHEKPEGRSNRQERGPHRSREQVRILKEVGTKRICHSTSCRGCSLFNGIIQCHEQCRWLHSGDIGSHDA